MNQIIGTSLPDVLSGTNQDDQILGLEGNDTLLGSRGDDTLSGDNEDFGTGVENDTADYSLLRTAITLKPQGVLEKGDLGTDQLINIETIIAPQSPRGGLKNTIDTSSAGGNSSIFVNLNRDVLTVRNAIPGSRRKLRFTVQNFRDVIGTDRSDRFIGDSQNNTFKGLGGNDRISGGVGFDTADYLGEESPITLFPTGIVEGESSGRDQLFKIERIIAPEIDGNLIDASSAGDPTSINVNLQRSRLIVENIPGIDSLTLVAENFTDVNGTTQNDSIVGDTQDNRLNGQGGNDRLVGSAGKDDLNGGSGDDVVLGGDGEDTLAGTDSVSRGQFEFDRLIGGNGLDQFILGDEEGAYYQDSTTDTSFFTNSFARINDFGNGDILTLGADETYRFEVDRLGFDIFTVSSGVSDLIADVRTNIDLDLPTGNVTLQADDSFRGLQDASLSLFQIA